MTRTQVVRMMVVIESSTLPVKQKKEILHILTDLLVDMMDVQPDNPGGRSTFSNGLFGLGE